MIILTKAQRKALFKIYRRDFPSWETPFYRVGKYGDTERVSSYHYRRLRKQVQPYFDNSGCVMLPWKGMWLGIETDGYTHS